MCLVKLESIARQVRLSSWPEIVGRLRPKSLAQTWLAHVHRTKKFNSALHHTTIIHHFTKGTATLPILRLSALLRHNRDTPTLSSQDPSKWPLNQQRTLAHSHTARKIAGGRDTDGWTERSSARARERCHTTARRHQSTTLPSMRLSQERYGHEHTSTGRSEEEVDIRLDCGLMLRLRITQHTSH